MQMILLLSHPCNLITFKVGVNLLTALGWPNLYYSGVASIPDRREVGPSFAHHLASSITLHPYATLHVEMLLFHFLPIWTLKSNILMLERGKRYRGSPDLAQKNAHFPKCRWSRKEWHFKCCTSGALPDDMGCLAATTVKH